MFLKHRKYISWILLLCAALGISAGITLQEWNRRNLSSNISETSVTMWEDTVAETQAALWEYGDTEESGTEISGPEENTYEPRTDSAGTGADFGFFSGSEGWRIAGVVFMIAGLISVPDSSVSPYSHSAARVSAIGLIGDVTSP